MRRWILLIAITSVIAWTGFQFAKRAAPPRLGSPIPDLTLESTDGNTTSLREFIGKPLVVVFVATWCEVCREEMPIMVETFRAHEIHDAVFLAVDSFEDLTRVQRFRDEFQIPFPILLDTNGDVAAFFRVDGTPTTFFIDRDGILRDVVVGGPLDRAYLDKKIAPLSTGLTGPIMAAKRPDDLNLPVVIDMGKIAPVDSPG